jgi:hypothetical protein
MTGTCLGQGTVYWAAIPPIAITAQTNTQQYSPIFSGGATNPGAIGPTAPASSGLIYYYELLYNTNFTGSQVPTPDAAALLGTWFDTGLTATNGSFAGRLMPVNPNVAALVPWIGTTNNIMLVGWSANLGTSWLAVSNKLANWAYYSNSLTGEAFFGESATGYLTPKFGTTPGAAVFAPGPTENGLPIYSPNMQLYWLPPPATAAPVIVGQPTNQNVRFGTTADFTVGAVSVAPMTYQWFLGTNAVLATTNSALCLTNIQPSQAGSYTVVVTNVYGAATSAPALLTVSAEPIIEDSPTNQQAMAGDTVNFSVVAVGLLPMAYHWFFETNAALEATNSVLCLTNVQPSQAGAYTVVVTNAYGATTSAPAMLTVTAKPVIEDTPTNQQAMAGDTVNFSVVAAGAPPLTYQWFFGTNTLLRATNSTLCLTNVQPWQAGAYTVVITNVYGVVTSAPAMLTVVAAPIVMAPPANQKALVGGTVDFSVVAVGAPPLAYQWFFGTNTLLRAKHSTLCLTNVQLWQAGAYTVVITNVYGAATSAPATLNVGLFGIVTNCSEADLRAAMAGGGTVKFACDGTITLSNTITCSFDTSLDGTGHQVTISGNNKLQVFYVNSNVTLSVLNLTIANGQASSGAGLLNAGGTVNLNGVTFRSNYAPLGGAIYNAGQMNVQSCCFTNNHASATGLSQAAFGGAIYNAGSMNLDLCQLGGNSAGGANGMYLSLGFVPPADGSGGAIYNSGQLTIDRTTLIANVAYGGGGYTGIADSYTLNGESGGSGANAFGGGICNVGPLSISLSTLYGNVVEGGGGGWGGDGIWDMDIGGSGGNGGPGGSGTGGALCGGASLVNCTIASNTARGGIGGAGGAGAGSVLGPSGHGGHGGNGGTGIDGGVSGSSSFVNCTIARNNSVPGAAGAGGSPTPSLPGSGGSAWGSNPTGFQLNVLLFSNTPSGNNTFANPQLGPLADNGGPTLTMALLPGSPAIDAGSALGALATDQRGVPRPQGSGVDIGAFECLKSPIFMSATIQNATNCQMQLSGMTPNPTLTLQVSTNLLNWRDVTNFMAGPNGVFQCVDPIPGDAAARFYRLKSGTP